jgi:hypothetical protein
MPELTRRYVVMTMAAVAPFDPADHDAPFVLKPWKDPAALLALKSYRDHCYPELARDLDEWIRTVESGPLVRGDVGRRNEEYLMSMKPASPRAPSGGRRRPPAGKRKRPPPKPARSSRVRGSRSGRRRVSGSPKSRKRGR